jgi:uncharacterized protein YcaQ
MLTVSKEQARRLAVSSQRLDSPAEGEPKAAVLQTIDDLGYVQIDTISVVERAHHHALWTRIPEYRPGILDVLQTRDRAVFEYWTHALSILPIADYRFYRPRMEQARRGGGAWAQTWRKENRALMARVLERIRREGGLTAKEFEAPPGVRRGSWWDWKPAKIALELLFRQGDLMISGRRGFQKVYDLTDRVLPTEVSTAAPSVSERADFHVLRALAAHGVLREREIVNTLRVARRAEIAAALKRLTAQGTVRRLCVDGLDGEQFALAAALDSTSSGGAQARLAHLLSPFDSLIIHRERVQQLFDFGYTLECYVPVKKRVHGYFVFPILWDDRLIGRLDPKADRQAGVLRVKRVLFESTFSQYDEALPHVAEALAQFACFNGCRSVELEGVAPARVSSALRRLVHSACGNGTRRMKMEEKRL